MALIPYKSQPATLTEQIASSTKETYAWFRDYLTAIKHGRWHPFTPVERKARAATRNQPWGPTGTELNLLAELTQNPVDSSIIFAVIELRLGYPPEKWRNVYKALMVLEFLVKRGDESCVSRAQDDFVMKLEDFGRFEYTAPDGKDLGVNVRHRAQAILALLRDDRRLAAERQALQKRNGSNKYQGFTRDQMQAGWSRNGENSRIEAERQLDLSSDTARNLYNQSDECAAHVVSSLEYRNRDSDSAMRNAGETKGVSMQENRRYLSALRKLLERPENRICADCKDNSAGSRPSWASINTGVFICMRCAGVHRGLGVHISKVRSCTLDTWLPGQVAFMAHTGNAVANSFWEARMEVNGMPTAVNLAELEGFIRRKYINRDFADQDACWPPSEEFEDDNIRAILQEMASPNGKSRAGKVVSVASPSSTQQLEAAEGCSGVAGQQQDGEVEQAAVPAPVPVPLINLLDLDFDILDQGNASEVYEQTAATSNPFKDLEDVFSAVPSASLQSSVSETTLQDGTATDPFAASIAWNTGQDAAAPPACSFSSNMKFAENGSFAQASYSKGDVELQCSSGLHGGSSAPHLPRPQYNPPWASCPPPAHAYPSPRAQQQNTPMHSDRHASGLSTFEAGFERLQVSRMATETQPLAPSTGSNQQCSFQPPHLSQGHLQGAEASSDDRRQQFSQIGSSPGSLLIHHSQSAMQPTAGFDHRATLSTRSLHAAAVGAYTSQPCNRNSAPALASPAANSVEAKLHSMLLSGLDGLVSQAERVTAAKQPEVATGPITPGAIFSQAGSMISMKAIQQGKQPVAATATTNMQ